MLDVIIICGGKGSRMKKSNISGPKILYKFANKHLFEHIITSIKNISYTSLSFLCNKKNINQIRSKIKTNFNNKNKKLRFLEETKEMGTGGFIYKNINIFSKDLLIIYGDLIVNFDLKNFYNFYKKNNLKCLICTQDNGHYFDSDLVKISKKNKISKIFKKPHQFKKNPNNIYAIEPIILIKKKLIEDFKFKKNKIDFIQDIIHKLIDNKNIKISPYKFEKFKNNSSFIADCGVPERYLFLKSILG